MKTYLIISALVITLLIPLYSYANTFCVNDATGLQTALTTASGNGEDDTTQIIQGTYVGSFIYASTEAFNLIVAGGFTENCASRVIDPANTVLDANGTGSVLVLSTPDTGANLLVDGITVQNGVAGNEKGGGIYANTGNGNISISNSTIISNSAIDGGGVHAYCSQGGSTNFINNTIIGNTASSSAGGILAHVTANGSNFLIKNTIRGNTSDSYGGGVCAYSSNNGRDYLGNNFITGNTSNSYGGGVYSWKGAVLTFANNTITSNTASYGGGIYFHHYENTSVANIINNIIWNNTADIGNDICFNNDENGDYVPSTVNLYNNDFDQSAEGTYMQIPFAIDPSNLDNEDPLFLDAPNDDYHLTSSSPCIDTGRLEGAPEEDIDGHSRPQGDGVDIGADEYIPSDGEMCKGLADYDSDVDGTDASMFKSHFGRSLLKNPCPPNGPAPVPKTGQVTSYVVGDDGDFERGVALVTPRFTDNFDGTVTDNLTGLIWLKNANCFGQRTWNNALSDANGLASGSCGLTDGSQAGDWRLPNYRELFSLVDAENHNPSLPSGHPFTNVQLIHYWSSTTISGFSDDAWIVFMTYGGTNTGSKSSYEYVWPVRGGH